jgi:hypothetical protein
MEKRSNDNKKYAVPTSFCKIKKKKKQPKKKKTKTKSKSKLKGLPYGGAALGTSSDMYMYISAYFLTLYASLIFFFSMYVCNIILLTCKKNINRWEIRKLQNNNEDIAHI